MFLYSLKKSIKNISTFKWDKVYNWMASGGFSLILYNLQKKFWMQVVCVGRYVFEDFCNGYSWWKITIKELIGRIICKNCSQYSNIILFQFKETSHYRDHSRWSSSVPQMAPSHCVMLWYRRRPWSW